MNRFIKLMGLILILGVLLAACGGESPTATSVPAAATATSAPAGDPTATTAAPVAATATTGTTTGTGGGDVTLILGAYTTPREAYAKLIPIFAAQYKEKTGQTVTFQESYQGSGAQSRAIIGGFEADIAALSLEADVNNIQKAGLITHDWKATPTKGMVSDSVVAFAVRKGNPKGIKDWADLAKDGISVLTPNPATSGGAQWNILALYGAAKRGQIPGVAKDDDAAAVDFMKKVLKNVEVMDKGARESITNFEGGVGDVAITYENEVKVGQLAGQDYELVIPSSSILIENPIAVVDAYAEKHGTKEVAQAFIDFLLTKEAQTIFADYGLRSIDPAVAAATKNNFPDLKDLFTIDYFGGWSKATPDYFGDEGVYTKAIAEVQQ